MLVQLLQSTIPASTKQLPTKTDQCSDQQLYLQQPVGRRRNSCSFNCFNPQYLRRPNSYQQKQISVPISNYTCSNQLVDAETVVRSTASSTIPTSTKQLRASQDQFYDPLVYLQELFYRRTSICSFNWFGGKYL